jgi:hypothetical protein
MSSGCPAVPVWAAGAKPSRNLALAASENGPRAVSRNVPVMAQPCTVMTYPSGSANTWSETKSGPVTAMIMPSCQCQVS